MTRRPTSLVALGALLVLAPSCETESPEQGSQTNWLTFCETSADCGDLECLCGVCTLPCEPGAQCSDLGLGSCVPTTDHGAVALCDGRVPPGAMCLSSCDDAACPDGTSCVAGTCVPALEPTAHVEIDPSLRYQALIGFGASLAYDEEFILAQPDRAALFDAMFVESGFDMIRLRNRWEPGDASGLTPEGEIVAEATARLGRAPILFMTSGSPPAALKANGDRFCSDFDPNCTLVRTADGSFDYDGFAEYWRASLEAYEGVGIHPDFVSIQNHPDFIPPDASPLEACRFLPEEGTATVTPPDGQSVEAEFPGYADALAAVSAAVGTLPSAYEFAAPEAGSVVMMGGYSGALQPSDVGAVAFHLYGTDPDAILVDQLDTLRVMGEDTGKPVIQSEMISDGLDTAILAHYTLTTARGSAYLQQPFVGTSTDETSVNLIGIDGTTLVRLPAYHALAHFARTTDPGWVRVDGTSDLTDVLASAWLSPDETSLTVVLINPTDTPADAEVAVPAAFAPLLTRAGVTRTVFDGVERSADLGDLPEHRVVRVPGRSIVTIATNSD